MPLFKIVSTDHSYQSAEIETDDPAWVLSTVKRLECKEADVLVNNAYSYSLRLNEYAARLVFKRDHSKGWAPYMSTGVPTGRDEMTH